MTDHRLPDDFTDPLHALPPYSAKEDWQQIAPHLEKMLIAARPFRGAIEACAQEATSRDQKQRLLKIADDLQENRLADEVFDFGRDMDPAKIEALQWDGANRQSLLGEHPNQRRSVRFSSPPDHSAEADRVVWNIVAYPAMTVLTVLFLALFIWTTIIPEFESIFNDFELPLAAPTEIVLAMRPFIVVATVLCVTATMVWLCRRWLFSKSFRSWISFKIPILGQIYRNAAYGKYCHLVSILLKSGAPLTPALRVACRGTLPKQATLAVEQLVVSNARLAPARSARFPHRLFLVMQSKTNNREKASMLRELASGLYTRTTSRAKHYLQPLVVLAVGIVVAFVVVSLFLPLVTLVSNLSG